MQAAHAGSTNACLGTRPTMLAMTSCYTFIMLIPYSAALSAQAEHNLAAASSGKRNKLAVKLLMWAHHTPGSRAHDSALTGRSHALAPAYMLGAAIPPTATQRANTNIIAVNNTTASLRRVVGHNSLSG